jgi:hypothetical protein
MAMTNKLFLLVAALLPVVAVGQAKTCDRACLESFVDRYLDALTAHDPQKLPMTQRVKNTEDGVRIEPGDGLWGTALAKGTYRLFVTDTDTGQVAFLGTMQEGRASAPKPIIIAVRLKIENGRVSEIENLVVRNNQAGANLEKLGAPNAVFQTPTPPSQRASRADLVTVANMYLSGLEKNDGQHTAPFADECQRIQNGSQTTNNPRTSQLAQFVAGTDGRQPQAPAANLPPGQIDIGAMSCLDQVKLGYFNFIQRIRDRRFAVVDRERGLVLAIAEMDEPAGQYATFKLSDGREITAGPDWPRTIAFFEIYKVEGGKIRRVEEAQRDVPYGMLSGWSSYEDGMSSKARTQ